MLDSVDHAGYMVIVKEAESKRTLLETKILEHNRKQHSIFITSSLLDDRHLGKLSLIVLGESGIYEYFGMPRKTANPNKVEISLFKGRKKEERVAKRYELNIETTVFDVTPATGTEAPMGIAEEEKKVTLLNLSSTGVLLDAEFGVLQNHETFKLKLDIAGNETIMLCKVMRIEPTENGNMQCGCKFIELTEAQK